MPGTKATTEAETQRKGKSSQHTQSKRFAIDTTKGPSLSLLCLRVLWQDTHAPKDLRAIHWGAAFHLICLLKSSSFMAYSLPGCCPTSPAYRFAVKDSRGRGRGRGGGRERNRKPGRPCDDPDNLLAWTFVRPSSPADVDKLFTALGSGLGGNS